MRVLFDQGTPEPLRLALAAHLVETAYELGWSMGRLSSDLCTIAHDEGTDYFVRAVLEVPIDGVEEPFTWGLWVSLSEKSFGLVNADAQWRPRTARAAFLGRWLHSRWHERNGNADV